ncbi:uncharacterized protein LOC126794296 [Argentina anserina]|uniref:uncharacterized protein LOC126794296 n=1 Tax=Argentina anserina TaxID=57926 RepID=UPI002176590E|nr:uncharacterized protein LOC126794296 [Potentilla anserina]
MRTTSEFMDKQIMELSRSYSDDFSQLTYPPHQLDNDNDDDLLSGFHFPPARHGAPQQSRASTLENRGSMDQIEYSRSRDSALIAVIDGKMNQHFGNLLHAVECLSARVSQLETRLRLVENSVDDLKDCTGVNYGKTDGKLREVENILRKVEGGMQDLRDKQEISEAQLQLAKLQMLKDNQKMEQERSNVQSTLASPAPQQTHQSHSTPVVSAQHPSLPPDIPPTLTHQNFPTAPTAAQLPSQSSQYQFSYIQQPDPNYSAAVLNPPPTPQANYMSQAQQSQPPYTAPYPSYPAVPYPSKTSQFQQQSQLHPHLNAPEPQTQYSPNHNPAEAPYELSQSYPQKTSNTPGFVLPSQQQFDGSMQYTHDQSPRSYSTNFFPGNMRPVQQSSYDDFYSRGGSLSHYGDSELKQSQVSPSSSVASGGSSFSGLPTAKVLPYALPMAASVDKESDSGGTGNRIPVDNVIDKVVSMGFRRDIVRATVRKMTENGQSVDLNVVLDKLMNSGEVQSQSGGYGR